MAEAERIRVRQREAGPGDSYERQVKYLLELRDRGFNGKVVMRSEDAPWEPTRQGMLQTFLCREADTGSALNDWVVFIHDIQTHSGKHRHQGGLVIYVLEGEGYTEVNGTRVEWSAGDLLLLPIAEGGVEHKHFNKRPGERCKWMAFIYRPYNDAIGYFLEQQETAPDFK